MATSNANSEREHLALRVIWMLVFFFVWQIAELIILAIIVVQLVLRLVNSRANEDLQRFGDSLSQYIAQIGRFGTFNTEQKPWPFADWPTPRPADIERAPEPTAAQAPVASTEPPKDGQP